MIDINKGNKINKKNILFVISVIFFAMSVLTKMYSTSIILTETKRKALLDNSNQKALEKKSEKISYILKVSDAVGEALSYIKINCKNGTKSQVITLLNDSIVGVNSISKALETMYKNSDVENIELKTNNLESRLNELMNAIGENDIKMGENIINSIISNDYTQWKRDIESEFR